MRRSKKAISILLSLVMVLAMIPAITIEFKEEAKAYSSYTKQRSPEYHYDSGTQFIYQLILYYSSSSNGDASNWLSNNGWTDWSGNFNAGDGHSSKYVHSGYKTTTNPANAIKGILVADGHPSSVTYGSATYYAVGSGSITQTPTGGDGCVDLNKGNGGDDLYLMATADYAAGPALTAITKSQNGNSSTAQNNLTNNGYRIVTDQSGNYQDTNAGAGGDYNYCGQKSSCTTVNSDTLRSNYAALLAKYNEISYYTYPSTTKANIESALNTASNILSDLNDGYTTYTQTQINNAASACSTQSGYMSLIAPKFVRGTYVRDGAAGYWAYAYVETNGGAPIARVQFPTWTDANGQDDIQANWGTNSAASGTAGSWTVNGATYNYRYYVAVSSHNNEYVKYNTHIYAYNTKGAQASGSIGAQVTFTYPVNYAGNGATSGSTAAQTMTYGANTAINNNGFSRSYTVTYNGNNGTPGKASDTATYSFNGWAASTSTQGYLINNAGEKSGTGGASSYTDFAQWTIAQPFVAGEEYTLEFDAYGTGTLINYFYGASGYLACAKAVSSNGRTSTGGDGNITATMTSSWVHYKIVWTLGSSGNAAVNKYVLFRANTGTGNVIHAKNIKFYQSKFVNGSRMLNQSTSGAVTMTAQWTGGSVTLPNATRTGFDFNGWYTAASGGTRVGGNGNAYTATANTTLFAQWTGYPYTVAFVGNGSTGGSMANESFVYGTAKALTANAFSRAYTVTYNYNGSGAADTTATATATFNGWATTATGAKVYDDKQSVSNLTTTKNGSVTLFANWTLGSVTLPTLTRNGYTFKGWYSDSTLNTFVGNGGASYTPTANATLFAKWDASDNTITFNANGGTAVSQLGYKITDNKTLPATSKAGYTFNNWKVTTAAGNWNANDTVSAGASVNGKYGNPTLTAQYTPTNYTITYNVDGVTSTDTYNIESAGKLPAKEKTGYDFAGWAISGNTGNWTETTNLPANTALAGRWGDVTLTAQWTPKTYGISYTLGDGASAANQPLSVEHGGSYTFTVTVDEAHDQNMPTVTATGATVSQTVSGNVVTVSLTNVTGEVAVNVPTTINTYAFTLNGDEGFTSNDKAQTVDYGSTVTFTVTLSEGYTQTAPTVMQGETELTPKSVADNAYTYEIANVTSDITVDVTATKNVYNVTVDAEENGDVVASGEPVQYGGAYRFSVTPKTGYTQHAPTVKVNGAAIEAASVTDGTYNYVVENVTEALAIDVDFTINTYTITWNDEDGTLLATTTANHGEIPAYPNANPTKAATAQYTYTFAGWGEIAEATADATYTASYSFTVNQYTVRFVNEDASPLKEYTLDYGAMPAYDGDEPTKAATAQYTYTFKDWDKEIVTVEGDATYTATFDATVNAYTVKFVNDGVELQSETLPYGSEVTYKGETPTRAATAQYTYSFSGWDNEIVSVVGDATYTATYSSTVNQYTVQFVNDDGALLKEYTLDYGATPAYDGETPEKAADLEFTYSFKEWTPAIADVTDNAIYTATYDKTAIGYLVRFLNDDGAVLQENSLHYGDVPAYNGEIPEKAATAKYTYTFDGWDKELAAITGDTDITATYTATVNEYTVTFKNYDGTVLQSGSVPYDETPEYTAETPVKAADAQYTYTFKAWDPEITAVSGDAEYTATYENTLNKYTVKFVNFDGEVLQEESLDYGTTPEYKGETPEKARTAEFTYNFTGWDKEIADVTGDTTYTAVFDNITNSYVVKFVNDDGEVLQEETLLYGATPEYKGETPTKERTAQYTYTFKDWGEEIGRVTGDKTYTAVYDATVNEYTVTFVNFDGEKLDEQVLAYGTTPVYAGAAPTKAYDEAQHYVFDGWTVEAVTGDKTYTATFTGIDHNWNSGAVKTPATCVAEGERIHACKDCGATEIRPIAIDPANHAGPTEVRGYVAATPDEHGYSGDTYCAACGTLLETGSQIHRTKGACNYCGGYHEGVWGSVVTAIHSILWLFSRFVSSGMFNR